MPAHPQDSLSICLLEIGRALLFLAPAALLYYHFRHRPKVGPKVAVAPDAAPDAIPGAAPDAAPGSVIDLRSGGAESLNTSFLVRCGGWMSALPDATDCHSPPLSNTDGR